MTYVEEHPIPKGISEESMCQHLRDYPWVPAGMSEEETVVILYEIAKQVAPRYRFGYNDDADMASQAVFKMIVEMKKGKFKPRGPKPLPQQLKNFARVWIRNRMSNYRRDRSCRYTKPDSPINKSKYNLMHPLHYLSFNLETSEMFARENDEHNLIQAADVLDSLSVEYRKLYLKYRSGVILDESDVECLFAVLEQE